MKMAWTTQTTLFASLLLCTVLWVDASDCGDVRRACNEPAVTISNCGNALDPNAEPTLMLQRTGPFDASEDAGETVESVFFPGMMVPPEVEKSLATLLSMETVKWIEEHDANGHAGEGININGQYIPADMKDVIRSYIKKYETQKAPMMDDQMAVRARGTNVGHLQEGHQRRALDLDCHQPRLESQLEKWMKQLTDVILQKDVLVIGLGLVLTVSSVSALLFVYGVSDVCSGILSFWYSCRNAVERFRKRVHEELPHQSDEDQLKSHSKQNGKHNARVKNKESSMNGKSTTKKRNKSHLTPKSRNDPMDSAYKRDARKEKKIALKGKQIKSRSEDECDANNEWQEVMHNKPKGRTIRSRQEEDKHKPTPVKQPTSQPVTPKTPELQQHPPVVMKSEECVTPIVKPIRTNSQPVGRKEIWNAVEDTKAFQLTMNTSGAFADEKPYDNLYGEVPFIQHSPFAASTDVPFFNNSPVRDNGYQSPSEQQFQSKVDRLLKNLRNKPFSVHPVSNAPSHPLRRSTTDVEEQICANRLSAFSMQSSLSGSLDPALSASGMLNNRLASLQLPFADDVHMRRQMSGGFPPARQSRLMSQRAGSLPLAQPQTQALYPLCSHGSMKTTPKSAHALSNDCSWFSSSPSIWKLDLAHDRDLVKSSMTNSTSFKAAATEAQSLDFKRCLPDQLLAEMGSFQDP